MVNYNEQQNPRFLLSNIKQCHLLSPLKMGLVSGAEFLEITWVYMKNVRDNHQPEVNFEGVLTWAFCTDRSPSWAGVGYEFRLEHSWLCLLLSFHSGQESRLAALMGSTCLPRGVFSLWTALGTVHMSERADQNSKREPWQWFSKLHADVSILGNWKHNLFWITAAKGDRQNNTLQEAFPWGLTAIWWGWAGGLQSLGQCVLRLGISPWNMELEF